MSTFTGKTVSEAVQTGLKRLHIHRSSANVRIIQKARRGFLGIGRRKAKIKMSKKIQVQHPKPRPQFQPKAQLKSTSDDHTDQHRQKSLHFTIKQKKPIHLNRKYQVKREKPHRSHHLNRHQQNQVAIKKLESYLGDVIRLLGISAAMKAEFKTSKRVKIDFKTDKEGLLIGKHGLTINALQALSKIFLNRLGMYHLYVELDTANYRQRRMDVLGRLAEKTAREAVATGKPVYLDPMPSFERKKIHKTLEDSAHVMTYSAGREPYRAVVVSPK